MTLARAALVAVAMGLPHLLPLRRAAPTGAIALCLAALALRAVTGVLIVLLVVRYLPATQLFALLTHWCWHAVLPFSATHLGLSGHSVGDAATVLPALVISASALSAAWGVLCAAHAVRRMVRKRALGDGPMGSLIVGGAEVVIAAAGLTRPKVIASAGALTQLDDVELAASLEHERGHIVHGHRVLLVYGELCRALGGLIPGSRAAAAELAFHLERDADAYAVARRHDPLDLASAICKAAMPRPRAGSLTCLGGGRSVCDRVRLLSDPPARRSALDRAMGLAAVAVLVLAIWLASAAPTLGASGAQERPAAPPVHNCPS